MSTGLKAQELDSKAWEKINAKKKSSSDGGGKEKKKNRSEGARVPKKQKASNDKDESDEEAGSGVVDEANEDDCDPHDNTKSKDTMQEMLRDCTFADFVQLCEALLCFRAWYKEDVTSWCNQELNSDPLERKRDLTATLRRTMAMIRCFMPRKSGNGWKIQKFHDIMHLAIDMERFGSPKNFDAGPLESSLRYWAKFPALTAQTRGYNTFVKQVAERLNEFQAFAKARRETGIIGVRDVSLVNLDHDHKPIKKKNRKSLEEPKLGGSKYWIFKDPTEDGTLRPTQWITKKKKKRKSTAQFPLHVEEFIRTCKDDSGRDALGTHSETFQGQSEVQVWKAFTECEMELPDNPGVPVRLRCHPDYHAEGEWFDWVMVNFGEPNETHVIEKLSFYPVNCVPCKILSFVLDGRNNKPMAVVHACLERDAKDVEFTSCLIEKWRLSFNGMKIKRRPDEVVYQPRIEAERRKRKFTADLYLIDLQTIHSPCLVMEETPGLKGEITVECDRDKNRSERWKEMEAKRKVLMSVSLIRDYKHWGRQFIGGWDD